MQFTDDELKFIVNRKTVGNFYPYKDGTIKQIVYYIKEIASVFEASKLLCCDADFSSYGSGFASYVDCFLYKRDGSSSFKKDKTLWIDGITLYISKFAPVAVWGHSRVTKHRTGGSRDFLNYNNIGELPKGNWNNEMYQMKNILNKYSIVCLEKKYVKKRLNFEVKIPTVLNQGSYKVFDALFYWED
ncbi:hypothetical protein [Sporosalibacterium faouarense]|uniref:hypothetical protein n=1 Tax=Sporosalibacterium faouarense TaxID=516123 RepID=UPI00192B20E8|nr:hypothetical protein [Sporosalibacterium faouarense]